MKQLNVYRVINSEDRWEYLLKDFYKHETLLTVFTGV